MTEGPNQSSGSRSKNRTEVGREKDSRGISEIEWTAIFNSHNTCSSFWQCLGIASRNIYTLSFCQWIGIIAVVSLQLKSINSRSWDKGLLQQSKVLRLLRVVRSINWCALVAYGWTRKKSPVHCVHVTYQLKKIDVVFCYLSLSLSIGNSFLTPKKGNLKTCRVVNIVSQRYGSFCCCCYAILLTWSPVTRCFTETCPYSGLAI